MSWLLDYGRAIVQKGAPEISQRVHDVVTDPQLEDMGDVPLLGKYKKAAGWLTGTINKRLNPTTGAGAGDTSAQTATGSVDAEGGGASTPKGVLGYIARKLNKPKPKAIRKAFWRWQMTRLILTGIVLVYGIVMVVLYATRKDGDDAGRDKLAFTQHVLWGDSGILGFLGMLWIFSLILLLVYPMISETVDPLMNYFLGPGGLVG